MTIGIIGAGALGTNLAKALAAKGLKASISNSRGPESLAALVEELGPNIAAGTPKVYDELIAALTPLVPEGLRN